MVVLIKQMLVVSMVIASDSDGTSRHDLVQSRRLSLRGVSGPVTESHR